MSNINNLYTFNNPLYDQIWKNHPSVFKAGEQSNTTLPSFQQMEFFGDQIISYVLSTTLMKSKISPKKMSIFIANNCSTSVMAKIFSPYSKSINYSGYLNSSILSDSLEAFIGCIHVDGGLQKAQKVIHQLWKDEINVDRLANSKNILQEKYKKNNIEYKYIKKKNCFECSIFIDNEYKCQGIGHSKKKASINAANYLINNLK